jgi:hypothetical protein
LKGSAAYYSSTSAAGLPRGARLPGPGLGRALHFQDAAESGCSPLPQPRSSPGRVQFDWRGWAGRSREKQPGQQPPKGWVERLRPREWLKGEDASAVKVDAPRPSARPSPRRGGSLPWIAARLLVERPGGAEGLRWARPRAARGATAPAGRSPPFRPDLDAVVRVPAGALVRDHRCDGCVDPAWRVRMRLLDQRPVRTCFRDRVANMAGEQLAAVMGERTLEHVGAEAVARRCEPLP